MVPPSVSATDAKLLNTEDNSSGDRDIVISGGTGIRVGSGREAEGESVGIIGGESHGEEVTGFVGPDVDDPEGSTNVPRQHKEVLNTEPPSQD